MYAIKPFLEREIDLFGVGKSIMSFMFLILMFYATQNMVENFNPDWFAYSKIFDQGGWDESKDIGFAFIINLFKSFGGNNYTAFRSSLAVYFMVFSFLMTLGKIIGYDNYSNWFFTVFIALVSCMFIRFTIQIREGVALTVILFSLSSIINQKKDAYVSRPSSLLILFWLFVAFLIHSGTLIFFLIFLLAIVLNFLRNANENQLAYVEFVIDKGATMLAFIVPFIYMKIITSNTVYFGALDTDNDTSVTTGKMLYWGIYGVFIFILRKKVLDFLNAETLNPITSIYLWLINKVLIKVLYILVVLFILLKQPVLYTSAFGRLLSLSICISTLILVFKTRNNFFIIIFSLFMIVDQIRTIIEALNVLNLL
jgi:hypothetical protein